VVSAPTVVSWPGGEGPGKQGNRRPFKRALGIAIATVALAALAVLSVGFYEDHPLTPGASAHVQLPGDLFAAPPQPAPRVIVRYTAPRYTPAPGASVGAPAAQPTPSARHQPSPSPSPSGGGDD
jgi:hypothetical protein